MKRISLAASPGISWMVGFVLAMVVALACATVASAQSMSEQYREPNPPSGGAAGASCSYVMSDDGVLNAGDVVVYPGNFSVAPGASVVLDDADGTVGTLVDGENAQISTGSGGTIRVTVTGDPYNVAGGDGIMNDSVCNSIVASTGISGLSGASGEEVASSSTGAAGIQGVLPETGGPVLLVYLGVLAMAGGGLVLLRHRALRSR